MKILKTDEVNLLLYQSNISSHLSSLVFTSTTSKDLVVYSAHFYRTKNHNGFVIFLVGASQAVYKTRSLIGCGVGTTIAKNFKVRYLYEVIRQHRWRVVTKQPIRPYQQLAVECYGVDVTVGDKAFLIYNNVTSNKTIAVQCDQPVVIPAPRITPIGHKNISAVTCTKVLSKGVSWLPEFLRYQKTLGVDHIHIAILDKFIKDGGFHKILENDTFYIKAIAENFITIQIWKEWYNHGKDEWFYFGNILMYLDCIYRYRGTYDFVSLLDTDDFFTIRVPGMSYKDFLQNLSHKKDVGSYSFKWLFYYPDACGLKKKVGEDGNVTASLVPHSPINEQGNHFKPIHLSKAVIDSSFHDASCNTCLLQGYRAVLVPDNIAYVAHNRLKYKKNFASKFCH